VSRRFVGGIRLSYLFLVSFVIPLFHLELSIIASISMDNKLGLAHLGRKGLIRHLLASLLIRA
jgi:hypothetical protein